MKIGVEIECDDVHSVGGPISEMPGWLIDMIENGQAVKSKMGVYVTDSANGYHFAPNGDLLLRSTGPVVGRKKTYTYQVIHNVVGWA